MVVLNLSKSFQDDTTVSEVHHDPSYSKIAKIVLPARFSSSNMTRLSGSQGKYFQIFKDEIFIVSFSRRRKYPT